MILRFWFLRKAYASALSPIVNLKDIFLSLLAYLAITVVGTDAVDKISASHFYLNWSGENAVTAAEPIKAPQF